MELFLFPRDGFIERDQKENCGTIACGFIDPIERILRSRITKTSVVLDASSGNGQHLEDLLRLSENVYVCDCSRQKDHLSVMQKERVQVVACTLNRLPFMDGAFDLVLLSDFHSTPPSVLNEIFRILKPQGLLLGTISGPEEPLAQSSGKHRALDPDGTFYRSVAERTATSLLEVSGFSVIHREFQLAPIPERIFLAQKEG